MSSLPPSSTPPAGDDSAPESQLPIAADAAPESPPVVAAESDSAPESAPAAASTGPAPEDCGPQLKQLYPALFSNPPKPLKLRIQADIQARSPGLFTKPQLSAFLRRYTGGHGYLNAIVKATHRFDLDGNPGDELSDEHRQAAVDELARRRTNTQARRALEDEQRFNRSILLRDFEVTKLDRAGFAALKGVPEGELDSLLERARKEAAETPPLAANRDRRGPRPEGARGPREPRGEGQERGPRGPRPPREARAEGAAAAAAPAADGSTPAPQRARPDAPRGPRSDAPRGPRPEGARGPRSDVPRGPQGARPDDNRGPRGPRPEGQRSGPRADGSSGPRSDAPRSPRSDRPRDDRPRGPRPDDARGARPNVSSSPAAPTAMELAFSALRGLKTTK